MSELVDNPQKADCIDYERLKELLNCYNTDQSLIYVFENAVCTVTVTIITFAITKPVITSSRAISTEQQFTNINKECRTTTTT